MSKIRKGTIVYSDVDFGKGFVTGHNALIREKTRIGDNVLVGSNVVIEGHVKIGNDVRIQTGAFISMHTNIEDRVFLGPHCTLLNDKYPLRKRDDYEPIGSNVRKDVTIGANATILPGVEIGERSFVGAGSVVTENVPSHHLAVGVPAEIEELPKELDQKNEVLR